MHCPPPTALWHCPVAVCGHCAHWQHPTCPHSALECPWPSHARSPSGGGGGCSEGGEKSGGGGEGGGMGASGGEGEGEGSARADGWKSKPLSPAEQSASPPVAAWLGLV